MTEVISWIATNAPNIVGLVVFAYWLSLRVERMLANQERMIQECWEHMLSTHDAARQEKER